MWVNQGTLMVSGLFSLKCNYDPNTESERIYFSDTARSCPSDFMDLFLIS